jgi:hypothetical protein
MKPKLGKQRPKLGEKPAIRKPKDFVIYSKNGLVIVEINKPMTPKRARVFASAIVLAADYVDSRKGR